MVNKTRCLLKVVGLDALGVQNATDRSDGTFTIQVRRKAATFSLARCRVMSNNTHHGE